MNTRAETTSANETPAVLSSSPALSRTVFTCVAIGPVTGWSSAPRRLTSPDRNTKSLRPDDVGIGPRRLHPPGRMHRLARRAVRHGDRRHLDERAVREVRDDRRPGRRVLGEHLPVDAVHRLEIGGLLQEDVHGRRLRQRRTGRVERRLQPIEHALRLRGDIGAGELRRLPGAHPGHEDQPARDDGGAARPARTLRR